VLAVRKLVAALLGRALVDGDAVRGWLAFTIAFAAALVFAGIIDNLVPTPVCCG